MRLFISLDIPEEIKKEITKIQKRLPEFKGKKTEKQNLHLTLKFLGEVPFSKLDEIKNKLSEIKLPEFKTKISKLGFFSKSEIRIIWLLMSDCEKLQKEVDEKLSEIFPKEKRFMGHLTIARVKSVENKKEFIEALESLDKIRNFEREFSVKEFNLMQSVLNPSGPEYKLVKSYSLG